MVVLFHRIIILTAEGLLVVSLVCVRKVRLSLAGEFAAAAQQFLLQPVNSPTAAAELHSLVVQKSSATFTPFSLCIEYFQFLFPF